jgi:hypothetical protein
MALDDTARCGDPLENENDRLALRHHAGDTAPAPGSAIFDRSIGWHGIVGRFVGQFCWTAVENENAVMRDVNQD